MFNSVYNNRRVLITGHTGFKGSWLALWLSRMGAEVTGYSLEAPTNPSHFELLNININSVIGDVRDINGLKQVLTDQQPEIIFHLAAQAIVRCSYKNPAETFSSNVMGTVNVLEAVRHAGSVRAVVNVTSDKCYENQEWSWGYREIDPLGGYDPYSASKGCSEIVTGCWQRSFFNPKDYGNVHRTLLASARAGNVIGGGDWASDRLIPDVMRAAYRKESVKVRNPLAIRPWQHVLEPLSGYLLLGQMLLEERTAFAQAWNFGPSKDDDVSVGEIIDRAKKIWRKIDCDTYQAPDQPHEDCLLRLDCSKARALLKWLPVWTVDEAVEKTIVWYKAFYESDKISSLEDLDSYIKDAQSRGISWACQ